MYSNLIPFNFFISVGHINLKNVLMVIFLKSEVVNVFHSRVTFDKIL
jgi:hypothetical protein